MELSWLEISREALTSNIKTFRRLVGPDVQLAVAVKGNAYGHGIEVFVPMAEKTGIDHFSVFSTEEAYRVSSTMTKDSEIMIRLENSKKIVFLWKSFSA